MRRSVGSGVVAGLLLLAADWPAAAAPAGGAPAVVERLEGAYSGAKDLTARFRQTSTSTAAGQVLEASGSVEAKRPGKMRWEYTKPERRLYVTDGKTFWAYSPGEKQVVVQETTGALDATPLAFLMAAATLREEFEVREVPHAAGRGKTALLELKPRKPLPNVRRLLLEVDRASGLIARATVFDAVGNTIVITLTDQRLNAGLPDSRFSFTPPPGVQVIHQQRHPSS